jgi:hypothetical protein
VLAILLFIEVLLYLLAVLFSLDLDFLYYFGLDATCFFFFDFTLVGFYRGE